MNTSHLHRDPETNVEVDAYGLRDHCNVCRKAKGLKPLSETEVKLLENAATMSAGSGAEPVEQLLADLKEQEEVNDQLRATVKEQAAEIASLKKLLENRSEKKKD